jgi:hypothetical protein
MMESQEFNLLSETEEMETPKHKFELDNMPVRVFLDEAYIRWKCRDFCLDSLSLILLGIFEFSL